MQAQGPIFQRNANRMLSNAVNPFANLFNPKSQTIVNSKQNLEIPGISKNNLQEVAKENNSKPALSKYQRQETVHDILRKEDEQFLYMEDGRVTKASHERLKFIDFSCFISALSGLGLSAILYDLEFEQTNQFYIQCLLWLISGTSVLLSFQTVIRYLVQLDYDKKRNYVSQKENLFTSGVWKKLIVEIIIFFLNPYPGLSEKKFYFLSSYDDVELFHHFNEIMALLATLRVYVIIRFLLINSQWHSNRTHRICGMYGCESGYLFTLKCIIKITPLKFISIGMLLSILIFGYALRICERPFSRVEKNMDFTYYTNSFWCVVVTITTVGYGDYFPRTFHGRCVVFLVSIWGVFIVSMMVVTITNLLNVDGLEQKAITVLQRLQYRDEIRQEAAYILTLMGKVRKQKKNKANLEVVIQKLKSHILKFKIATRIYRSLVNTTSLSEEMSRQFDFLRDEFDVMQNRQEILMKAHLDVMRHLKIDEKIIQQLDINFKNGQMEQDDDDDDSQNNYSESIDKDELYIKEETVSKNDSDEEK